MKSRLALLAVPFLALACTDAEQATLIAPESTEIESSGTLTSPGGDAVLAANAIPCVGGTITGTKKADIIDCRGSSTDHTISGGGGNDIIYGGDGADIISGGASNDIIYGGGGDDMLCGGVCDSPAASLSPQFHAAHSPCAGHKKNDPGCDGGGDNDTKGGSGSDKIWGEGGNDTIKGGSGDDELHGGPGNDNIDGGNHADLLYGDEDDDILKGSHHNDALDGGTGEDHCDGGAGNDTADATTCETIINVP